MADQLPFQEAIDFLSQKVNLPTRRSDDLRHGAHVRAFSVAGVTRDDMLSDFRVAIEKARSEGTSLAEFRKDFDKIVERYGWKYFSHGKTDEERSAWRSKIIFTTNMRTSYMAGRWKQMTDPDVMRYRPYLEYIHSGSEHPRLLHLSWNGKVLRADDPAWRYMFPPNGFGCFCDVESRSERDLKRMGKSGPDPSPDLNAYEDTDPRTGQPEMRIPGIDRGWEYNVGHEWLHGVVPTQLQTPLSPFGVPAPALPLPPLPKPAKADPADLLPDDDKPENYVSAFLARFGLGADEAGFYRDVSGGIIGIDRSLFEQRMPDGTVVGLKSGKRGRGQYAVLLADAIQSPDEVWVDWAAVKSGAALRRAYLKRVELDDGRSMFIRFEWTKNGWNAVTGFDTTENYLENYRKGALIYRKQ
ncbi:PBECR2 nuclease fold domain-containing protein [Agrobacterium radiobacter]|uniref:PBECR2 nuclease fold domain-containing protein n=1 Tax=Agrobacterium radiobacter TaxID=362 RepID=UPI003F825E4F